MASRSGKYPTLLGSVGLVVVASTWLCTRVMTCHRLSGNLLLNLPMPPWCCRLGKSSRLFDSTLCLCWCGGVVRHSLALLGFTGAQLPITSDYQGTWPHYCMLCKPHPKWQLLPRCWPHWVAMYISGESPQVQWDFSGLRCALGASSYAI